MKSLIKKALTHATLYYTVITAVFSFVMMLSYGAGDSGGSISATRVFLFLPFSLLFATANALLSAEHIQKPIRYFLHCVLTLAGAYICLIMPADLDGSGRLMGSALIVVVYAVLCLVCFLFRRHLNKALTESNTYKKQIK